MLILFSIVSELVYLFFVFVRNKSGLLDLHNNKTVMLVVILLGVLFILYFYTYYSVKWTNIKFKQIFIIALIINFTLLFTQFLTSNDLYSYIAQSRIFSIYGENPYLINYDTFVNDQFYQHIKTIWSSQTSLYGPLFLFTGGIINIIGRNNLNLTILLFKILFFCLNLVNAFLIYKITKSSRATFLYTLNPLVIFELSGNAHNESLFIFFILISLFLVLKNNATSFVLFTASILVKYSSFVLLPLYLVFYKRKRWSTLILIFSLSILIILVAYYPFWEGIHIFSYLRSYYGGKYISPSLGILIGQKVTGSYELSFKLNTLIFIVVTMCISIKFYFSKFSFKLMLFNSLLIYWIYLITKLSLVLTWYLTPLIALASLCIIWKKSKMWGEVCLIFVSLYSLPLFYFVR